jgi:hypothetical protein
MNHGVQFVLNAQHFNEHVAETIQSPQPAGHAQGHAWAANLANEKENKRKSFFLN